MTIYTPLAQLREPEGLVTMAVRVRSAPIALAASLRADVRAVSPDVVVDNIRTMEQQIGSTLVRERLVAFLCAKPSRPDSAGIRCSNAMRCSIRSGRRPSSCSS